MFISLGGSTNDKIRDAIAPFLYLNSESISRHPQVYNILYEMFRISRHESLSYFDWGHCGFLRDITDSFLSTTAANNKSSEVIKRSIEALLERLVSDDLLGTLMLCAYASD
ncbi:hypothetical protein BDV93DRAFT_526552, partial [Ceratobasidium sp. AG-I]